MTSRTMSCDVYACYTRHRLAIRGTRRDAGGLLFGGCQAVARARDSTRVRDRRMAAVRNCFRRAADLGDAHLAGPMARRSARELRRQRLGAARRDDRDWQHARGPLRGVAVGTAAWPG